MLKAAYRIEYDLRNIIYEHLSRMSFSFYDRVQSGQLISRANSDIRQVQMYLAMAPTVFVQCSVAVLAFALMLTINVPLAFVAMSTMPFVLFAAIRMRRYMFPVSWLIQARLAEVGDGRRREHQRRARRQVVRGRGAPAEQADRRRASGSSGRYIKDADIRGRWAPLIENLPRLGQALVLLYGGYLAINGQATVGDIVAFNAYVLMLQPPFRQLGMVHDAGPAGRRRRPQRIYEVLDEPADDRRPPGCRRPRSSARRRPTSTTCRSSTPTARPCSTASSCTCGPGETVALVGRTGTGKSTAARLLARFYDVTGGAVRIDGHDVRDLTLPSLRHHIGMVLDEPFLFSVSIRDNIAYGRPDATLEDVVAAARGRRRRRVHPRDARGLRHGRRRARVHALRRPAPAHRDRPDAAWSTRRSWSSTTPRARSTSRSSSRSTTRCGGLMAGRTTLIIAHRLSTISLADRVAVIEDGRVIAEGTHAELLASEPRYNEILAQTEEDARRRVVERDAARAEFERTGPKASPDRRRRRCREGPRSRSDVGELGRSRPRARDALADTLMASSGETTVSAGGFRCGGGGGGGIAAGGTRARTPSRIPRGGCAAHQVTERGPSGGPGWPAGRKGLAPDAGSRSQPRPPAPARIDGSCSSRWSSSSSRPILDPARAARRHRHRRGDADGNMSGRGDGRRGRYARGPSPRRSWGRPRRADRPIIAHGVQLRVRC